MSSPASHRDEPTDLSPTVTNTSMDSEPKKAGKRVLSCVLCQQRKKKCDRKTQNSLHSKFASSAKEAQASESRSSGKACEMRRTS
ncbi:uncharacterized protein FPRO_08615 [Fusarium proliferatum ET1]|uniref:Zn(2)-C6 fungal-type domain-containing protein n=1 Tax=Fusarium proliferatum (strain ET1) TaxID=1227346 RepID=A0A1L7W4K4_FUSPR|nr:uncharacterized protein FPRO_08615 [Fusarium proliferatum ET1]CVL00663.1 uncharacterized protein FPRN_08411 [Fusarium proliferatum]CZR47241.1 uncharacterized protein FPRO_08615 [Fusarium proliferatum ET1]